MNLNDGRCTNEADEPFQLSYAPRIRKSIVSRIVFNPFVLAASSICVVVWLDINLDYGHHREVCTQCGAQRAGRYIEFFRYWMPYNRTVNEGIISKSIQEHRDKKCAHAWETAYCSHRRMRATYRGMTRYIEVRRFESFPDLRDVIIEQEARDPEYIAKLEAAVQTPRDAEQFWFDLALEVRKKSDDKLDSKPAAPGS